MSNKNSWRILSVSFNNKLHDAMQQQHHAAQFPALVGKYLIPQEPDDSNTNMQILPGKDILAGNRLSNGFCVALNLINLEISLLDENDSIKTGFALNGKTKQQGFSELKKILSENRIDTSRLKNELHYEIPAHKLDEGFPFVVKEKAYFEENTKQRHNAEVILKEIISTRENAAPVRVWPHHFDTGTSISLARNEQGTISSSIGLGWAIPDTMVDEPYFYLSFWSEKPVADVNKLPALKTGNWITSGWQGGVLTLSDILVETSADAQYGKVKLFFESGIEIFQTYYT